MKQDAWVHLLAYALVSLAAMGMAFLVSLKFLTRSRAQGANPPAVVTPQAPSEAQTQSPPQPAPPPAAPPASGAVPPQAPPATAAQTVQPAAPPKTGAAAIQESATAVAAEVQGFLEPFIYDSKNRRDPFQPYTDFRPTENQPTLSPLQRFDLEDLRLVGIMWDVHSPKAMFLDPDKQVHVAGRDESIGRKNGYIAVIREGEVVVVESSRKDGEVQYKPRVIRMER